MRPPRAGWSPQGRRGVKPEDLDVLIERPIKQLVTGSRGAYRILCVEQKPMSVQSEFKVLALAEDNQP